MSNRTEFTQRSSCDHARTDSAGHDHIIRRVTDGTFILLYRGSVEASRIRQFGTAVTLSAWLEHDAAKAAA
jgi:hypothetical protein